MLSFLTRSPHTMFAAPPVWVTVCMAAAVHARMASSINQAQSAKARTRAG